MHKVVTIHCTEAVHNKREGGSTKRAGMRRGKYKGLGVGDASPTCDHHLTGYVSQKFFIKTANHGEKCGYVCLCSMWQTNVVTLTWYLRA